MGSKKEDKKRSKEEKDEKKLKKQRKEEKKQAQVEIEKEPKPSVEQEGSAPSNDKVQEFLKTNEITIKNADEKVPFLSFSQIPAQLPNYLKNFKVPTPIQSAAWPFLFEGKDVVGIAETGSGKTLAFSVPIMLAIKEQKNRGRPKVIVVSPTRELAMQIHETVEKLSEEYKLKCACIYGGMPKHEQRSLLRNGSDVIIGTPGRLCDFIDGGELDLSGITHLVLDEADRMLDQGFERDIKLIISSTPVNRQTIMFSATWPESVRQLSQQYLKSPVSIMIGQREELNASQNITQIVQVIDNPRDEKDVKLVQLLQNYHKSRKNRILIFALYKKEAARLESLLQRKGYKAIAIHGDKNQNQRTEGLQSFKDGSCPLLIATDVASRGLDIPDVEYVINYTFPLTIEDYVHRIGRTGRAGKKGIAHTFFTFFDKTHSGELINVLKTAGQDVPESLLKFGTTTKKKEHKTYGAFFKDIDPNVKGKKIVFDDDD